MLNATCTTHSFSDAVADAAPGSTIAVLGDAAPIDLAANAKLLATAGAKKLTLYVEFATLPTQTTGPPVVNASIVAFIKALGVVEKDHSQEEALDANALLAEPGAYVNQSVRVHGRLADVCQKAGCWMVLADQEGRSMRVTTGHEFFIDRDTIGDDADIEGKIERKEVEAETVEHFKSEASSPDSIIPEEGKTHTYELVATTVAIRD